MKDWSVDEDTCVGSWAKKGLYKPEENQEHRNITTCTTRFDPLLADMLDKNVRKIESVGYDPSVVQDTAAWLMVMPDSDPDLHPQPCNEAGQFSGVRS